MPDDTGTAGDDAAASTATSIDDRQRRLFLAAVAGGGLASLAGCTEGADDEEEPTRPELNFDPNAVESAPLRFIVESLEYQNAVLEREVQ